MKLIDIEVAESEVKTFLSVVKAFYAAGDGRKGCTDALICGCPESAALRRRSMDLTRALAKMRRP